VSSNSGQGNILRKIADELAIAAAVHAEPAVKRASTQLAEAMYPRSGRRAGLSEVFIPHYWAAYRHDGRRAPLRPPPPTKVFVWFRDPRKDPRLRNGKSPQRLSQVRRLKLPKATFREMIESGEIVVRRLILRSTAPTLFFDNDVGMRGFWEKADGIARPMFSDHVTGSLRRKGLLTIRRRLIV
jgi:hypothetical protein